MRNPNVKKALTEPFRLAGTRAEPAIARSWGGAPHYQIQSKSQLNPFLLEEEKRLRKRKRALKYLFGKAFFFKERFLVALVYIGIWDFQEYD
jgi:hypothetical protein